MTKRMLIDATHAEETRVVVLDGNRLEDFDVETSTKKQLKGNIYLAKIVRVEPSLQAAFVEYGGGRHGFLAFGEIHPDYYQIPVADRQRLLAMQAEEAREEEEAEEAAERALARQGQRGGRPPRDSGHHPRTSDTATAHDDVGQAIASADASDGFDPSAEPAGLDAESGDDETPGDHAEAPPEEAGGFVQSHGRSDEYDHSGDHVASAGGHEEVSDEDAHASAATEHEPADSHPGAESTSAGVTRDNADETPGDHDEHAREGRPAQPATIVQDVRFGDMEPVSGGAMHVPGAGGLEDSLAEADAAAPGPESAGEASSEEARGELREDFEAPEQDSPPADLPPPETIGGETDTYDGAAEARARRASRLLRNYRIQEVIRRRQIMLIQVVKEERGSKGAALTTYISLAGRFCVLMPNSPRGGGISRKITSGADRKRLKEITTELEIPRGMGLIVRTAGAARPKPEIKRDCEYLMRLWDDIREHTLKSVAPALIYEEASLIKRAIRDVYSRDVEEILVDGEQAWRAAHDFMRMLMPSHAKKVQLWSATPGSAGQPLFSRQGVEAQLDGMLSPTVQLRSGGYLVIAQTEALVSIDVNSGRSTRERGIEETALKTNLEAADEVARQLRLRDLAGLIVIDFIDMESRKNNASVERRMKEALKNDRARIQVGHISHFGLMEMSRQRLRPSLAETSFATCPHCGGLGHVRSIESSAIHVLRSIEDEGAKQRAAQIMVFCAGSVALYLLNNKRERLGEIEARHAMIVHFTPDDTLIAPAIRIERLLPQVPDAVRRIAAPVIPAAPAFQAETDEAFDEADEVFEEVADEPDAAEPAPVTSGADAASDAEGAPRPGETAEEASRRRRRRRRRGGRRDQPASGADIQAAPGLTTDELDGPHDVPSEAFAEEATISVAATFDAGPRGVLPEADAIGGAVVDPVAAGSQPVIDPTEFDENGLPQPRGPRRSRRGGRRRRRFGEGEGEAVTGEAIASDTDASGIPAAPTYAPTPYAPPVYTGPTPADPFAGQPFDIFDLMDQPLDIPPVPPNARPPSDVEPHVERPVMATPSVVAPVVEIAPVESGAVEADTPAAPVDVAFGESPPAEMAPTEMTVAPSPVSHEAEPAKEPEALPATEPHARAVAASLPAGEPAPHVSDHAASAAHTGDTDSSVPEPIGTSPPHEAEPATATAEPMPAPVASAELAKTPAGPDPSVVQPVVIGKDAPASTPKRGWWRA